MSGAAMLFAKAARLSVMGPRRAVPAVGAEAFRASTQTMLIGSPVDRHRCGASAEICAACRACARECRAMAA